MSYPVDQPTPEQLQAREHCAEQDVQLNAYVVTRIVFEVIRKYLMDNPDPKKCGVMLSQRYNSDPTKSDILLDIGYNWRTQELSKVPAIFVQRGDLTFKTPTIGQEYNSNVMNLSETRFAFASLPITVSCVAAEPIAVVENLAELVKQPLLYFRREVQNDFGIRQFKLLEVGRPKLVTEGKNNFVVDLSLMVVYDDAYVIRQNSLKIGSIAGQ